MLIWLLTACGPEPTATLYADVTDANGQSIAKPTIEVRDATGAVINTVEGDERGNFNTSLPVEDTFYLIISADGYEKHSFTGRSGVGEISAESGALWLRTPEAIEAVRTQFSEYPECASTAGAFVDGQTRIYINGYNDLPISITTATLKIIGPDKLEYPSCYIPPENPDNENEITDDGEFAIFGLVPGVQTINLEPNIPASEIPDGIELEHDEYTYTIYVPENGFVAKYPLLVPILE